VYVRDVTEALEAILKDKATIGKTYALAGPRTYTCVCRSWLLVAVQISNQ
jgi:hypothetical protein